MHCGIEQCLKLIVVGNSGVGKTCLLHRFAGYDFIDSYVETVGAQFLEKEVTCGISSIPVKLMLWDTSGEPVFNAVVKAYYRDANAAVLAFSTVDHASYIDVKKWKHIVESVCGPIAMVLCETKYDLSRESCVTNFEATNLAEELQLPLFCTSSKDNFNISNLFEFLVHECLQMNGAKKSVKPSDLDKALSIEKGGIVILGKEVNYETKLASNIKPKSEPTLEKVLMASGMGTNRRNFPLSSATDPTINNLPSNGKKQTTRLNQKEVSLKLPPMSTRRKKCKCMVL